MKSRMNQNEKSNRTMRICVYVILALIAAAFVLGSLQLFGKGADIGDKTLVDALKPCAIALTKAAEENKKLINGLELGAKAAHEGAEATKTVVARLGRAGTVGERSIGFPDAGAHGLDVIFNELVAYIKAFK